MQNRMKTKKERWVYLLKWTVGIIIVFTFIIKGFLLFWAWLYFVQWQTSSLGGTRSVFAQLLQIPYSGGGYISNSLKEGWQDLEPISYEEWMSMECECPEINNTI